MPPRSLLIHFHCGDLAAAVHRKSGLPGELRVWRDSPAVGPWTAEARHLPYLRSGWWGQVPSSMRDLPNLEELGESTEPTLWFGPDPWEQACLLWILAELPPSVRPDIVPLDRGVAHIPPSGLPGYYAQRVLLETQARERALEFWKVFLLEGWGGLRKVHIPELPFLGPALARLAEDHPPWGPGRTRRQVQTLVTKGVRDLASLMEGLKQMEDRTHGAWYGDMAIARMVEAMGVRLG